MGNDNYNLGKLKKVELREAWKHEASNFTHWVAEEENLTLLGDEIGLEINVVPSGANPISGPVTVEVLSGSATNPANALFYPYISKLWTGSSNIISRMF